MSASPALFVRSWRVVQYECTLTVPRPQPGHLLSAAMEWTPAMPTRLTDTEMREYRQGRNLALAEISAELQITAAVVEL